MAQVGKLRLGNPVGTSRLPSYSTVSSSPSVDSFVESALSIHLYMSSRD